MSIFKRIFKIGEAEVNTMVDKFEDPIKMTEQGIRDLKADLQTAMAGLTEMKANLNIQINERNGYKKTADDYEKKAMIILQKIQDGSLTATDGESLATEALVKKDQAMANFERLSSTIETCEGNVKKYEANITKLKDTIVQYETELTTLRSRAKTAESTSKIQKSLSSVDPSGTIARLEKMKKKIEEKEALVDATNVVESIPSFDDKLNAAAAAPSTSLDDLRKKMGIS